ncbi:hypothetical protein VMCG_10786 [Cytospora schulzeri]|uniref:Uncharacterized protein n=1 Tax=Cytospora schulzeri TaxID=448051 RepID=A0A423V989_9PEZI|nr:hypothetical protein VMCG_10786 [Valsa malicola]
MEARELDMETFADSQRHWDCCFLFLFSIKNTGILSLVPGPLDISSALRDLIMDHSSEDIEAITKPSSTLRVTI